MLARRNLLPASPLALGPCMIYCKSNGLKYLWGYFVLIFRFGPNDPDPDKFETSSKPWAEHCSLGDHPSIYSNLPDPQHIELYQDVSIMINLATI